LLDAIRQDATGINDLLCASAPLWEKPLAISPIPYGYIGECADGVWRIGDQAAVIPSFTGDGMSIAMHSAALAAEMYLAGESAQDYAHCLRGQLSSRMRISMALSRLMVTPYAQIIAPLVLSAMPKSLAWIAGSTRIPARAIRSSFGMPPTQLPPAKNA
jgi:flavin-dependent dehydrogenase